MFTKTMIALTTVLALGTSFASAATVRSTHSATRPTIETRVPATGAEQWQDRGNIEDAGYAYRR
jgi:hypothetical protein